MSLGPVEDFVFYHSGHSGRVKRALVRSRAEVVHAHFGTNGAIILPTARTLGLPLVVSFHGHDVGGLEPQNRNTVRYYRYQRLARDLFSYSSRILCASEEMMASLSRAGAPESKLVLHQLGVDTDYFRPDPTITRQEARILCVGRLVEKKGLGDAISAFSRVVDGVKNARLAIAGDGPLRSELRRQAEDLGVSQRVEFLGVLSPEQVRRQMREASVLLTPSFTPPSGDRESGVIVLKEAGALGLPVVATRHGGIPEVVEHGQTGLLVAERDVVDLANQLSRVLRSRSLRTAFGENARTRVLSHFDTKVRNSVLESHLVRAARGG